MEEQGSEMDGDALSGLNLTEADIMNLQQAGVLVTNQGTPHFTQTDLEALASIQDDLETFNIESNSGEIVDIADLTKDDGILDQNQFTITDEQLASYEAGLGLDLYSSSSQNLEAGELPAAAVEKSVAPAAKTIQIVRPAVSGFNKLKLVPGVTSTTGTQQIRIQPAPPGRSLASAVSVSGSDGGLPSSAQQQMVLNKFVNIFPSTNRQKSGQQIVNVLNADGSVSTLNIQGGEENLQLINNTGERSLIQLGATSQPISVDNTQTIHLGGGLPATMRTTAATRISVPASAISSVGGGQAISVGGQAIKIVGGGGGGQTFRIVSGGKLVVDPSSPAKQAGHTKQQLMSQFKPEQGQVIRTADGRLIAFTSAAAGAKNLLLASPNKKQEKSLGQIIRLQSDTSGPSQDGNKVQLVRVVNSLGENQTMQLKVQDKNKINLQSLQGMKSVTSGNSANLNLSFQSEIQKEIAQVKKEMTASEPPGLRPRKPCNCTKSQCLKLYCDCFANGEFCYNCNCNNCHNNLENEEERQRSIRQCLDRNPNAFRPKIGKNPAESDRRHNKGCNCKRSGCLKNYCECYEAKIICTDICKCLGCKNVDERTGSKMNSFSFVEEMSDDSLSVSDKLFKPSSSIRSKLLQAPNLNLQDGQAKKQQPFSFVTQEVVEATCQCLLAQAEDGERLGVAEEQVERQVLEEFGRCLSQIIDFAQTKT